jgi:hypothetical protein
MTVAGVRIIANSPNASTRVTQQTSNHNERSLTATFRSQQQSERKVDSLPLLELEPVAFSMQALLSDHSAKSHSPTPSTLDPKTHTHDRLIYFLFSYSKRIIYLLLFMCCSLLYRIHTIILFHYTLSLPD